MIGGLLPTLPVLLPATTEVLTPPGAGYVSAASAYNGESQKSIRVRFYVTRQPSNGAIVWIAGYSAGGAVGFLFDTETNGFGGVVGVLQAYAPVDGNLRVVGRKIICPTSVGHIMTLHSVFDTVGGLTHFYVDGYEAYLGSVATGIGFPFTVLDGPGVGDKLGVGNSPNLAFPGEMGLIEVAISSTILTPAQVLADARAPIGTAIPGQLHRYTASPAVGATWGDASHTADLTRNGAPTLSAPNVALAQHSRTFNLWGDSITRGLAPSGFYEDGFRRTLQMLCCQANIPVVFMGSNGPTGGAANFDYDFWNNGTGSEQLHNRLATFPADLAGTGSAATAVVLFYGLNDIAAGRTAAQLTTDVQQACADIDAARPGALIIIVNLYDPATAALTGPQHAQLLLYNNPATFANMIGNLRGLGYNVGGADISSCITNPNDPAQLFDGTHPSATYYGTYPSTPGVKSLADVIAASILANLKLVA